MAQYIHWDPTPQLLQCGLCSRCGREQTLCHLLFNGSHMDGAVTLSSFTISHHGTEGYLMGSDCSGSGVGYVRKSGVGFLPSPAPETWRLSGS